MKYYIVTGMSCAACQARVEKAVSSIENVESCAVNFLTATMSVEGNVSSDIIIKTVEKAGYKAREKTEENTEEFIEENTEKHTEKHTVKHTVKHTKEHAKNRAVKGSRNADSFFRNIETVKILKRLTISIILLIPLFYLNMGHKLLSLPLPAILENNPLINAMLQFVLSLIVMLINNRFFVNGFKGLVRGAANMDTLVAMGSATSFAWSSYILYLIWQTVRNYSATDYSAAKCSVMDYSAANCLVMDYMANADLTLKISSYMEELYFESAAMILVLITVGKLLEAYSKGKTTNAIKKLIGIMPKTAVVVVDGKEKEISSRDVKVNDILIIRAGSVVPADALVIEGSASVDESSLTGESIPVYKSINDNVSAGTINTNGFIKCKALKVGKDTKLSEIIKLVENAAATKAPIGRIADKVSGVFVPIVIFIAVVTIVIWFCIGYDMAFALSRGISVLVISCPCALGLATPVAIMVGNGKAASNGILFKNSVSLENLGKAKIALLDKTGTLTNGKPHVTDIIILENATKKTAGHNQEQIIEQIIEQTEEGIIELITESITEPITESITEPITEPITESITEPITEPITETRLLEYVYALETKSNHPLAKAIIEECKKRNICRELEISDFKNIPGKGLYGSFQGRELVVGNLKYISENANIDDRIITKSKELASEAKIPVFCALDGKCIGIIAVADTLKLDSIEAVKQLKELGLQVVLLTGDNKRTATAIAMKLGITDYVSELLPADKEKIVNSYMKKAMTIMVGDGINDAPALTRADIGIAIASGTDIAIDSADLVLANNNLVSLPAAIRLSRQTLKNIYENLFWAFFYNLIDISLATGMWYPILGLKLNPMFSAAAMSLSSFCVVSNALRLNMFKLYRETKDKTKSVSDDESNN